MSGAEITKPIPGAISEVGLELPDGLSVEEWSKAGRRLSQIDRAVQWWIGDWLNYGERTYGDKYADAVEITGYSEKTLRNFAYVARAVEMSRRRDDLSWSHHAEVASFGGAEQDRWLMAAEANGWSKGKLRTEIRDQGKERALVISQEVTGEMNGLPIVRPEIDESEWHRQRIEATAERINKTVFRHLRFATSHLPELRGGKYFGNAISEMDRDWLKALPREIERARENLLDLARDIERVLAEEES